MTNELTEAQAAVDAASSALFAAEKHWGVTARAVTPDEWHKAIRGVRNVQLRVQLASVVWWDFIHTGNISEWGKVCALKDKWVPDLDLTPTQIADGLFAIGYPRRMAVERVRREPQVLRREARAAEKVGAA